MLKNIITTFIIVFVVFALFNLTRQIQDSIKAGERLNESSDELQDLQKTNQNLNKQLQLQTTPDYIESQIRNKLNLSRPGETILIIDPVALNPYLESTPSPTPKPPPNWQGWLKLFGFR